MSRLAPTECESTSDGADALQAETPRSNKPDSDVKEGSLRSVAKRRFPLSHRHALSM